MAVTMRVLAPLLLLLSLSARAEGPHAREAALHAQDAEAAWVRATPLPQRFVAAAPTLTKRIYGYLPYWQAIDVNAFHWELLTDVVTFSVGLGADGTVSNPHALPGTALASAAHAHGVKVHVCATLFNTTGNTEIASFLASTAARAKAAQQLAALAGSADGINLDFEFVPSGSRDAFTGFVQQLRAALPAGAQLTIAMPSSIGYTGYDTAALAAATDRLLLMEYDYHWRTAPNSGPNSPLSTGGVWSGSVESAVTGFLGKTTADKLAVGVPYYGYDWPTASGSPGAATSGGGATVLLKDVFGKFGNYGRLWDSASQTPWYHYTASSVDHQGWVDDGQSLGLKFQYVNQKGLAGIMIWALGYDTGRTEAWDQITANFVSAPPAADGKLQIVSAAFSPAQVDPGGLVTATLHVKNVGGQSIGSVAPPPSTIYDETQSSTGSIGGTWRLALDLADRPSAQQTHPFRWGLPSALAAGAETDVSVQVRLQRSGARTLWAAVIHEGVEVAQDNVGLTTVTVSGAPDAGSPDAGSPDGGSSDAGEGGGVVHSSRGCSSAGALTPLLSLLLLLLRPEA